ncbi:MAG: Ig-like domain-containing protein [Anaerolineae bacterium]
MKLKACLILALVFLVTAVPALAQDESLSLRLSRDFGYSLGGQIQGAFSFRVSGPDDLSRVLFFVDGEQVGEDSEAPFRLQFRTETYGLGSHTMSAAGFTSDGRELQSNQIRREFVSGSDSTTIALWIIIPILVIAIGGRILSARIANRRQKGQGQPAVHGAFGTAVCPKCGKPFAMHIWGFNVVAGKFDRCPHCGKWSLVRRAHPDAVQQAIDAMTKDEMVSNTPSLAPEEELRKKLDDSRFDA